MSNALSDPPRQSRPQSSPFALVDLHTGHAYSLRTGPNSIGRAPKNHIVLADDAVSRRHAVLMVHETGACEIGDADSRNGVFLNGRQVFGAGRLEPGAVLQIDGFRFLFTQNNATDSLPISFTDEALGVVVWNAADGCWYFHITLGVNRFVPAAYSPPQGTSPESVSPAPPADWEVVRACVRQVRAREAAARELIGKRYWGPQLAQVLFANATATLVYEESASSAVSVVLDQTGAFVSGPRRIRGEAHDED